MGISEKAIRMYSRCSTNERRVQARCGVAGMTMKRRGNRARLLAPSSSWKSLVRGIYFPLQPNSLSTRTSGTKESSAKHRGETGDPVAAPIPPKRARTQATRLPPPRLLCQIQLSSPHHFEPHFSHPGHPAFPLLVPPAQLPAKARSSSRWSPQINSPLSPSTRKNGRGRWAAVETRAAETSCSLERYNQAELPSCALAEKKQGRVRKSRRLLNSTHTRPATPSSLPPQSPVP